MIYWYGGRGLEETSGDDSRPAPAFRRGGGISIDSLPHPSSRLRWGLGLSILLHLLLVTLALTLLPSLAQRLASSRPTPFPDVVTVRLRDRVADVDPSSATKVPQETPLIGRERSVARDRVQDANDTPVPSGAEQAGENTRPGSPSERQSPPETAAEAAKPRPPATDAGIADAISNEVAMLTGRRPTPERSSQGRGARTDAEDVGAMQFGDFSFSTEAWDYEPYWYYMRERLYANWHPPAAYRDYGIIQGGWTIVRAVLDRQGKLLDAKVLGTKGHETLHPASLAAMLGAAPFRPLPETFPDDSLVVTVRFIYLPPGERAPPSEAR